MISGMTPNHALNAGRAWLSRRPNPLTVMFPRSRAAVRNGVSGGRQPIERNVESGLAYGPGARCVGERGDTVERGIALLPRHDLHFGSDGIGNLLRFFRRAVGDAYLFRTLRREARDDRT